MEITLIAVGKLKEPFLRDAYHHFFEKLSRKHHFHLIEIPDEKTEQENSPALDLRILEIEGQQILKKIPQNAFVIALAIDGTLGNSTTLLKKIREIQAMGKKHIVFIIGGSLGLSHGVLSRANWKLSFSPMTFPHQLMRIILMEQLDHIL